MSIHYVKNHHTRTSSVKLILITATIFAMNAVMEIDFKGDTHSVTLKR